MKTQNHPQVVSWRHWWYLLPLFCRKYQQPHLHGTWWCCCSSG